MFKNLLSTSHLSASVFSTLLLVARISIGLMFLNHGMQKWLTFGEMSSNFPDPLHIGSAWSLILIIISEVVCSFFFIWIPLPHSVAPNDIYHGYGILRNP